MGRLSDTRQRSVGREVGRPGTVRGSHGDRRLRFPGLAAVAVLSLIAVGCLSADRPELVGAGCDLTSSCREPLVCRLGRCRVQCERQRDCGPGKQCVLDADGRGACLLADEASCELNSDCPEPLVCRSGGCANQCANARDCPQGMACQVEAEGGACVVPIDSLCVYHSDCPEPLICDVDQQCRFECVEDRDCPAPRRCAASLCVLLDGGP